MSIKIDDAYLYEHMPKVERELMDRIPPEEELDHKFSRRFERKMKKLMKEERRTPKERKVYRGMKLAFAAIAVVALIAFSSVMSVKAYRFRIVEFFVEVFTELTSYSVQEERPDWDAIAMVEPSYLPEGYSVIRRSESDLECFVWYENSMGEKIHYMQTSNSSSNRLIDTETCVEKKLSIQKQEVIVIKDADMYTVYWNDKEHVYSIIGATTMDLAELINMARSVIDKMK